MFCWFTMEREKPFTVEIPIVRVLEDEVNPNMTGI